MPGACSSLRSEAGPDNDESCNVEDELLPEMDDSRGITRGTAIVRFAYSFLHLFCQPWFLTADPPIGVSGFFAKLQRGQMVRTGRHCLHPGRQESTVAQNEHGQTRKCRPQRQMDVFPAARTNKAPQAQWRNKRETDIPVEMGPDLEDGETKHKDCCATGKNSLETQFEAGALDEEPTWESIAEVRRAAARQIVERDMLCLRLCRKEVLEYKKWVGTTHACKTRDGQQNTPKKVNHKRLKRAEERNERSAAV